MAERQQDGLWGWILGGLLLLVVLATAEFRRDATAPGRAAAPTATTSDADALAAKPSRAGERQATVTYVLDGDSLVVMENGQEFRVRLLGVDAPEKGQTMAEESRAFTIRSCLHREVQLAPHGKDRYDRVLAEVFVDGNSVNQEIVRAGLAWAYDDSDPELLRLEQQARQRRQGIWTDSNPIRPADWRRMQTASD